MLFFFFYFSSLSQAWRKRLAPWTSRRGWRDSHSGTCKGRERQRCRVIQWRREPAGACSPRRCSTARLSAPGECERSTTMIQAATEVSSTWRGRKKRKKGGGKGGLERW